MNRQRRYPLPTFAFLHAGPVEPNIAGGFLYLKLLKPFVPYADELISQMTAIDGNMLLPRTHRVNKKTLKTDFVAFRPILDATRRVLA